MSELEKFAERYSVDLHDLRRWLIEAMVLGAVADGEFDSRESERIIEVIASHSEFTGMDAAELRGDLDAAFHGIVSDGFHVRLHALAGALPRYVHRVLAFRAAVAVAFANGRLDSDEFSFLRQMQKVLGIAEADIARAFEEMQSLGRVGIPAEVAPVECYLDCLLMAAAADGQLAEEELATIIAFVISREEFEGIDEDRLRQYINSRLEEFADGGIDERLEQLTDELLDPMERENAYGLAAAMAVVDGDFAPAEKRFLQKLQAALSIDEARAEIVLSQIQGE